MWRHCCCSDQVATERFILENQSGMVSLRVVATRTNSDIEDYMVSLFVVATRPISDIEGLYGVTASCRYETNRDDYFYQNAVVSF